MTKRPPPQRRLGAAYLDTCRWAGVRVAFAKRSLSEEGFFSQSDGPSKAIYLIPTLCWAVIPPRNNRLTRSCWTLRLSEVTFAQHAADSSCSRRRKCHHVGSKSTSSAPSSPSFDGSGHVQPPPLPLFGGQALDFLHAAARRPQSCLATR